MTTHDLPAAASEQVRASTRILLVDDHELARRGVRSVLEYESDLEIVAEASDVASGLRALRALHRSPPDLVVVDVRLPDGDGASVCEAAVEQGIAAVVLTAFGDEEGLAASVVAGAGAVVLKDVSAMNLLDVLRRVSAGERLISDAVRRRAADCHRDPTTGRLPLWRLTARERSVLSLMTRGLSNRQIGAELQISEKTVKNHMTGLLAKLGLTRRTQVVALLARGRS